MHYDRVSESRQNLDFYTEVFVNANKIHMTTVKNCPSCSYVIFYDVSVTDMRLTTFFFRYIVKIGDIHYS